MSPGDGADQDEDRSDRDDAGTPAAADASLDDTDAGWGEAANEEDREAWIRAQRPPHWG